MRGLEVKVLEQLKEQFLQAGQVMVLTGAGCSTRSGIPAYRDKRGHWMRSDPIQHQDFVQQHSARQRYWARSLVGWRYVCDAEVNQSHLALALLEAQGRSNVLVTQNVDGLHSLAGSEAVIDLHGRLDRVLCLDCKQVSRRADLQQTLVQANPELARRIAAVAPDGDAQVDDFDIDSVVVPVCERCGGMLKPDVVFFGDNVPRDRVLEATEKLNQAAALLVVGSSLMVYSGYRFCRMAVEMGKPIWIINDGMTRADDLASLKIEGDCAETLSALVGLSKE